MLRHSSGRGSRSPADRTGESSGLALLSVKPEPPSESAFRMHALDFGVGGSMRRSWRGLAPLAASDRSGPPAPVTFSNSQPFQSRPNPRRLPPHFCFLRPPLDSPEAVLVSSDPSSGSESGGLELILREEAWRGPPGPDILGMICSSPPSFCPCLRTRVAAACIHWTRLAVRAGLGGAVGSVSALTGAGHFAIW